MKVEQVLKPACRGDAIVVTDASPSSMGSTLTASVISNGLPVVQRFSPSRGTADFLCAVGALVAVLDAAGCRCEPPRRGIRGIWTTYVYCPLESWVEVFGERQSEMYVTPGSTRGPLHVWEYPCSDGTVRCITYLLERPEGPWILVVRVCCSESRNEMSCGLSHTVQ